jgi:hypothetical protein
MAKQQNYRLSATNREGAVVGLGGFMADNERAASMEAADLVRSLIGGPHLDLDDFISIVGPNGPVGAAANVLEFIKRQ